MGLVKIKGVKATPEATVRYVMDKEKTMERILVDGINCTRNENTIIAKMKFFRKRYQTEDNRKNLSFHVIHSYSSKENISAEKAHEISMEWFKKSFPSDVLAVASTHNNTDSLHTHFVVNNVSLNGKGLSFDKTWQRRSIEISNELCKKYNLIHSIVDIDKPSLVSRTLWEYQQYQQKNSWKEVLRKLIDSLIKIVKNIKQLFDMLRKKGYEVNEDGERVTIKPDDIERTINIKSLGKYYSIDQIEKRIEVNNTREETIQKYTEIEEKLKAIKTWKTKAIKLKNVDGIVEKIKTIDEKEKTLKEELRECKKILRDIEKGREEDVRRRRVSEKNVIESNEDRC